MIRTMAVAVLVVLAATDVIRGQLVELFEPREHHCTDGRFQGRVFPYRLFVPRAMKTGQRYPLLIWMHGRGDGGTDNARHLKWLELMLDDPTHPDEYRFFILAVQCPMNLAWFDQAGDASSGAKRHEDMLTVTANILQKTMSDCTIDPDRVYLLGISSGAAASWELAMREPELFAAVVPLASGGSDESRATKLVKIPIWAFVNQGERIGVAKMVAVVQAAGGNAYLTVANAPGHDAWSAPLQGGILDWILVQRRSPFCWTPPGHDLWQWWHVLTLPTAILVFLRLAWCIEQRRRRFLAFKSNPRETVGRPRSPTLPCEEVAMHVEKVENCGDSANPAA
jgi:poly(3-hydroxybutyrate) depolymerase